MSSNPYSVVSRPRIGIGIVGFGTVGQGVWKHIEAQRADLNSRLGLEIDLVRAAVRDLKRERAVKLPAEKLTADPMAVVNDPRVHIVCELMGGTGIARDVTLAALRAGKVVVSANKALICEHGDEIFRAVRENGGRFFFEASVAGGIPIIKAIREGLVANRFDLICGIINGTTNYILSRMEKDGLPYETILNDARSLGYVEADESLDLDGVDAFHKAAILAFLAHGKWVDEDHALVEGIRKVTLEDIRRARDFGYRIKLLAVIRRDFKSGWMTVGVYPALLPLDKLLARVDGGFNGITLSGDVVGAQTFVGRGAGQDATASAVIGDIVDALIALRDGGSKGVGAADLDFLEKLGEGVRMARLDEIVGKFYLRLTLADRAGVLADVYRVFAEESLSIARVVQYEHEGKGTGTVTLSTYETSELVMERVLAKLRALNTVLEEPLLLRIFNPEN